MQDCSEAALGENLTRLQNSSKQATVYIRLQEYWVLYLCCFVGASAGLRGDQKKWSEKAEPTTDCRCHQIWKGISALYDIIKNMCKVYLRVPSIRVADRLANPQGEQGLVAGVRQRVDGLGEHAGWSSVDPRQEFEEEVQPIAADKYEKVKVHEQAVWNWPVLMFKI